MPVQTGRQHGAEGAQGANRNGSRGAGADSALPRAAAAGVGGAAEGRADGASWWRQAGPAGALGLAALYAFTVAAVAGYGAFGVDPSRLLHLPPWAASFYGKSFGFFAQGHVWLAMAVLTVVLVQHAGARWLVAFGAMYALSLGSELAGTTWGIPFGEYGYTALLGPAWLERVPVVIPLSWFFMALPSYALAGRLADGVWGRILAGSLVLLAWDLALDPAMSFATRYWTWGESGPYYGMPWLNLFGWYVTGVALMAVLAWRRAGEWTARIGDGWWAGFYGANLLLPVGMCVAAGLWGAVAATAVVLVALLAFDRRRGARRRGEVAA
jgi:uncharacterized membrane protein